MTTPMEDNSIDLFGTARLRTISCAELQNGAPRALNDLFLAATEDGVFYLDFESSKEMNLSRSIKEVERLNRAIFDMPVEEKLLFDVDSMGKLKRNGYKPLGRNRGGIEGQRDGFESYGISRDTMSVSPGQAVRHPGVVAEYGEAMTRLTSNCLNMTQLIFKALSTGFGLLKDDSFESRHDSVASPLDLLRLLRYPNAIGDGAFSIPQLAHADMGSLTFLFTVFPGLQILPAGTELWQNVPPVPGRAVVNFGDAMKIFSGGKIESVVHRVITVPGKQVQDRYSFAFMVRPEPSAQMTALPPFRGELNEDERSSMTCEEWVSLRFSQLRVK